jgi:hypothetical protein
MDAPGTGASSSVQRTNRSGVSGMAAGGGTESAILNALPRSKFYKGVREKGG